jgi:hypothetical protein
LLINTWTLLEFELGWLERILGICSVGLTAIYLACLPYLLECLPRLVHAPLAKAIKIVSIFLSVWPIWALLEAEHVVHLEMGIVLSTVLWCLYAALAMTVVAYALNHVRLEGGSSEGPPPPLRPQWGPIPPTRPCPPDIARAVPGAKPLDPIVHQSIEFACSEASRLGHDYIGTEHVLLGLLKLAQGSFARILRTMNVDSETVRSEIERLVCPVPAHTSTAATPLTPRATKAIRLAAREAKALNHSCIGAEHIFLGLLLEGSGVAAKVLKKLGIQFEQTREEIVREFRAHPAC